MRRMLAVVLVVLGLAGLVLGRLGETVWAPETERTATVELADPGPAVVIDPGVAYVGGHAGQVTITAPGDVTVIRASSDDVTGYLGDATYTRITGVPAWGTLSSETVQADGPAELPAPLPDTFGPLEPSASPVTLEVADLWEQDSTGGQPHQPLLVLTDGKQAGATEVTMRWPVELSTPWVPYAYAIGAALTVIGLVLFLVDFAMRRSRDAEDDDAERDDVDPAEPDSVEPVDAPDVNDEPEHLESPAAVAAPAPTGEPAPMAEPATGGDPLRPRGRRRALVGDETAPTAPLDGAAPADVDRVDDAPVDAAPAADGETPQEDPAR
ncbi:hypothetical protein [Brachybacterium huguangmaarense]